MRALVIQQSQPDQVYMSREIGWDETSGTCRSHLFVIVQTSIWYQPILLAHPANRLRALQHRPADLSHHTLLLVIPHLVGPHTRLPTLQVSKHPRSTKVWSLSPLGVQVDRATADTIGIGSSVYLRVSLFGFYLWSLRWLFGGITEVVTTSML